MTYNELCETVYQNGDDAVDKLDDSTRKAYHVLALFKGRKGFDWWWGGIDMETQDEIFESLRQILL